MPKETRIKAALASGIDIVLELPFVYATASAEYFAFNAVKILSDFGCDKIAFGTENAEVESLNKAVDILLKEDFDNEVKKYYNDGVSFPVARQMAFDKFNINCDNLFLYIDVCNKTLCTFPGSACHNNQVTF